jgi:3'(2'), 5'-bisphosphate nucleotidase
MDESEYRPLAKALSGVVLAAGRAEMRHYHDGTTIEIKADATPVTAADREAEAIIVAALRRIRPDVPIVAEEETSAGSLPTIGDRFFLVDPLDGTREFIAHCGEFTINIALVEARRPVFGLVYAPAMGELYVTLAPSEAFMARIAPNETAAHLWASGLTRIASRAPDPNALSVIASRLHMNPATELFLAGYRIAERRSAGSSLKFCMIAKGEADLYPRLGQTTEWDTAAGHAVLAAAGGTVTTLDGATLLYGKADAQFRNPDFIAWGRVPLKPTSWVAPTP